MLGNFQKSQLRIEVKASQKVLHDSFLDTSQLNQWFCLGKLDKNLPSHLESGLSFSNWILGIEIENKVEIVNDNCLRLLLSKAIDGYQEWYWGDGWVQSRLYGVSILPLNLGQTLNLLSLRNFIQKKST